MQKEESHGASAKHDVTLVTPPRGQIQSRVGIDRVLSHRIASSQRVVSRGIVLYTVTYNIASHGIVSHGII